MYIVLALLIILAAVLGYFSVKIVPEGENWTVERFGKWRKTLEPGLEFIVPFADQIGMRVNMMERTLGIDKMDVITKDNAVISADAVTFYRITDAKRAAYEVYNLREAIAALTVTNIRSVIGSMELDHVSSEREHISDALLEALGQAVLDWGVKVTQVEIRDLVLPDDIKYSMAKQLKAEREKRAAISEAEGWKQSKILRAEGQKAERILEAQGQKEATILAADARKSEADAEAVATAAISKALNDGDQAALQYFVAQKYVESLRDIGASENSKLVMMPLEASSLIGSIAGIGELLAKAKPGDDATTVIPPHKN